MGQLNSIPSSFYINLPEALVKEVRKCKDDNAVKEIGIEWCIQQSKELVKFGVPCLHYYTMGDVKTTSAICREIV